jgi:hypothetical protein
VLNLDAPDVLWIEIQPCHFQSLISPNASAYIGQGDHERHRFNRRQLKSEREVKRLGVMRDCMHDAPDLRGGSQPAFGPRAMYDLSPYSVKGDVHRSPTAGPNGTRNRSGQPRFISSKLPKL